MDEEVTPTSNDGSRRRKAPEKIIYSWSDLETKKSNAACAMDRLEFLVSTRNRFTEFRAQEADRLRFAIRSKQAASPHMRKTLSLSAESAAAVLVKQVCEIHDVSTSRP
ncbi:bPT2 [Symbiodinium natans]|uniref:BPT2 protein n=1 Tax=Symbiodinium natans TaxID=878477 RepID=A0A812SV45_9DINO|nr:bPT2 [Symbiodinium natans]